jgi:integrase
VSPEHKTLTVRSAGKKKGVVSELTAGQWAAWLRAVGPGGYLEALEREMPDYPLFPQGRLVRGQAVPAKHGSRPPLDRTAVRKWFAEAEELAEIPHVAGRGPYGLRRIAVDAAKDLHISREGLKALGGWSSSEVPDNIYADQEALQARSEAARVRAQMRGEDG